MNLTLLLLCLLLAGECLGKKCTFIVNFYNVPKSESYGSTWPTVYYIAWKTKGSVSYWLGQSRSLKAYYYAVAFNAHEDELTVETVGIGKVKINLFDKGWIQDSDWGSVVFNLAEMLHESGSSKPEFPVVKTVTNSGYDVMLQILWCESSLAIRNKLSFFD